MTIIKKLEDLLVQATRERSHYYVAGVVKEAITEILRLEGWVNDLQSGMYINCVYCGHRYGPDEDSIDPMRGVLEKHIESCPKHPLSVAKATIEKMKQELHGADEAMEGANNEIERLTHLHNLDHSLADQWQAKNEALLLKMKAFFWAAEYQDIDNLMQGDAASFRKLGLLVAERTKALARSKQ